MTTVTTHVLDAARGRPAAGLEVSLEAISPDGRAVVVGRARTDADGRSGPLGDADGPGLPRLVFATEGYLAVSGLGDLIVLKTSGSEFTGYITDRYTTLPETTERILSTAVTARWRHRSADGDWGASFAAVRALLLDRFAETHSRSLQQTLHAMAAAVIDARAEVCELRMSMPNRHHFVVDLAPFGLANDNEIFRVEDRPYGLIEAQITAAEAPPAGPAWDPYPLL